MSTDSTGKGAADAADPPLAGFTVLDLLDDGLGDVTRPYAELGAAVVRVAPHGAFGGAEPRSAAGARWLAANLGKRLILPRNDAELQVQIDRADLIVTGIARASPEPSRRETVVMRVSMFGAGNSYEAWQATDSVLHALSGELSRSGLDGCEPLLPPGELALQCAMTQAAYVGMAGLYAAALTGVGDRLDVSLLDGAVQALDPGYGISGSATLGRAARHLPTGRPVKGFQYPIFACADGQVRLCVLAPRQWQSLFRWMGEPAEFATPAFANTRVRQESAALTAALAAFFAGRSRAELEREGSIRGVPISGILTVAECLASSQVAARGAVAEVPLPDGGAVWLPAGTIEVDGVRMSAPVVPLPVPDRPTRAPARVSTGDAAPTAPLAGIKVLDLGVIVVGGEQSRLLADLGADVVKIESASFPDGLRHSYLPTGLSVSFAAGHRNKRSLGLDLRRPEGRALFLRLAAEADVILSNFKPGTMASLGLSHTAITAINPRIVIAESSAFGATGPWAGRMGYGPLVRAAAGLTAEWRYPGSADSYSDSITIYPDHVCGRLGALAVLALLIRRLRTGRGGRASISQMEVMLAHMAGRIAAPAAAAGPPDAPWGVFRAAGEDEWCVVTVRGDADWRALGGALGRADWADDGYATVARRIARRAEIERDMAAWMAIRDADAAMRLLQEAGVPAARMLRVADLPEFGYFVERDFFRVDAHPLVDEPIVAERRHAVSRLLADPNGRPAPLMGEHSAEVVRDWLNMDDAEIALLLEQGILEPVPPTIMRMVAAGEGRRAG